MRPRVNRQLRVIGVGAAALLVIVVLAGPVSAALPMTGLANAPVSAVVAAGIVGVVVIAAFVVRRSIRHGDDESAARAVGTVTSSGWEGSIWNEPIPLVVQQPQQRQAVPLAAADGTVEGYPARFAAWVRRFYNIGAVVGVQVTTLTLPVRGLPVDVDLALGPIGAGQILSRSPARWAASPPLAFAGVVPVQPWAAGTIMLWPRTSSIRPESWAPVAAQLDPLGGWVAIRNGIVEVSVDADDEQVELDRLIAVAASAVRVINTR